MSSNFGYNIIWEKWRDPFGSESDYDSTEILSEDDEDNEEYDETTRNPLVSAKEIKCKVVITPFGAIPYNENTASGKIFNFWTGHANFSITRNIADIIEDTDGVETLDIFTRYRFRISIGKAFQDSTVMRSINDKVYSYLEE